VNSSPPDSSSVPALPKTLDGWLQLIERRHHTAVDLGLDRCVAVWRKMGSPTPGRRVYVVAGTNGKGSTVATLCSLLYSLGYRVGSYTTPHISEYNERVRLGRQVVDDQTLVNAFEQVEAARGDTSLSYFEFGTLAAIRILADHELDFAVMEIGLGGRLDAVNVLDSDCAVITPIGLDHQEYLGPDLESIGREKAGIMRPAKPVICGDPNPPSSVVAMAGELAAPMRVIGRDFSIEPGARSALYRVGGTALELPLPVLYGKHQLNNAVTAVAALLELIPEASLLAEKLADGLRSVDLKGRLERVRDHPTVWIDVGHNPLGARVVAQALRERGGNGGQCIRCVLAMLVDKDAANVAQELSGVVAHWYCAGLDGDRGQTGRRLAGRVRNAVAGASVQVFERVEDALRAAIEEAQPTDGVLVFGSFHTADEAHRMMVNWPSIERLEE
jgi:dihydrofolate synthase/folylpolyglutamate synthase